MMFSFFDYLQKVEFNIYQFLNIQKEIAMDFENVKNIDIGNLTEREFINKYGLYLLHIIDEAVESIEANNFEDLITELIDTMMYIGSADALITFNIKEKLKDDEYIEFSIKDLDFKYNLDTLYVYLIRQISHERMLFPQRKWHKEYKKFTDKEYQEVLLTIHNINKNMIMEILYYITNLVLNEENIDINEFINNTFVKKQNKIENDNKEERWTN